jgi:hypothetical protein
MSMYVCSSLLYWSVPSLGAPPSVRYTKPLCTCSVLVDGHAAKYAATQPPLPQQHAALTQLGLHPPSGPIQRSLHVEPAWVTPRLSLAPMRMNLSAGHVGAGVGAGVVVVGAAVVVVVVGACTLVPSHSRPVEHVVHVVRLLTSPPPVYEPAPQVLQAVALPLLVYLLSAPHGTFAPLPSQA